MLEVGIGVKEASFRSLRRLTSGKGRAGVARAERREQLPDCGSRMETPRNCLAAPRESQTGGIQRWGMMQTHRGAKLGGNVSRQRMWAGWNFAFALPVPSSWPAIDGCVGHSQAHSSCRGEAPRIACAVADSTTRPLDHSTTRPLDHSQRPGSCLLDHSVFVLRISRVTSCVIEMYKLQSCRTVDSSDI